MSLSREKGAVVSYKTAAFIQLKNTTPLLHIIQKRDKAGLTICIIPVNSLVTCPLTQCSNKIVLSNLLLLILQGGKLKIYQLMSIQKQRLNKYLNIFHINLYSMLALQSLIGQLEKVRKIYRLSKSLENSLWKLISVQIQWSLSILRRSKRWTSYERT